MIFISKPALSYCKLHEKKKLFDYSDKTCDSLLVECRIYGCDGGGDVSGDGSKRGGS